nr:reverse transcriptase domain-containing protein [Tanacetum cinerariifolium]
LRSKDETPEVLKDFLTMIQRNLQAPALDYDNSGPVPQLQNVSPSADTKVHLQQELDLLFDPLYDECFTVGSLCIKNSSSPADNSKQQDTPPITNIQSSTKPTNPTNGNAEENNNNQAKDTQFYQDEFFNPFCTLDSGFELTAFLDADHVGCIDTRKSTSKRIQFLGDKLVSWMSNKQDGAAMSLVEAEYVALSASCAQFNKKNPKKRGNVGEPSKDRNGRDDNKRTRTGYAFAITTNPIRRENTRHLAKDYRVVPRNVNPVNARNPVAACGECFECGGSWENGNQARRRAFMLGAEEACQDSKIMMDTFTLNNHYVTTLFDFGTDYSFVFATFIPLLGLEPSDLGFSYKIEIAGGLLVEINKIKLVPEAILDVKSPYRLALSEMEELSGQLKKL